MPNIQGKPSSKPQGSVANRKGANRKKNKVMKPQYQEKELNQETLNAMKLAEIEAKADKRNREKIKAAEEAAKRAKAEAKKKTEEASKKTPTSAPLTLTLEDQINNQFDEMATGIKYAKNEEQKKRVVDKFNLYIRKKVPAEKRDDAISLVSERLKEDDFIYGGGEFIQLEAVRPYFDDMFKMPVEKSTPTNEQNTSHNLNVSRQVTPMMESQKYQALVDGINNEEVLNPHKGYSNDDLKKIIAHHNTLLESNDGNGTNFESLYENSYSDLKKFADGTLTIDKDSYETMKEFIKIFGTNSKGIHTPEGKAAYDKLMALVDDAEKEAKKDRILQHKNNVEKNKNTPERNTAIIGIIDGLGKNAKEREKNQTQDEFGIGDESNQNNNGTNVITPIIPINTDIKKPEGSTITPIQNSPKDIKKDIPKTTPENITKKEKEKQKKGFLPWLKKKWPWLAAAAAATLLFLARSCGAGDGKPVAPIPGGGDEQKPDTTITVTPDTVKLERKDIGNGFFLERSAGFKGEQGKTDFNKAENANKQDLLILKKSIIKGDLDQSKFVRNSTSKNKEPVSIVEIGYKLRIAVQNFPKSKISESIKNIFSGKAISEKDKNNAYAAFNHIDDYGNLLNKEGNIIKGTGGKKEIAKERLGNGSEEYGTKGTFNNFTQVLKNHKDGLNK